MVNQKLISFILLIGLTTFANIFVECRPNYNYNQRQSDQMIPPDYLIPLEQENMQDYIDKTIQQNQINEADSNFLTNLPYFRELLRLRDLTPKDTLQYEIVPTPQPIQQIQLPMINRNLIKDTAQKKNSNSRKNLPRITYMHACHFKICNMGRKRNVRYDY